MEKKLASQRGGRAMRSEQEKIMIAVREGRRGEEKEGTLLTARDRAVINPVGVPFVTGIEREGGAACVATEDTAQVVLAWWIAAREVSGRGVADDSLGVSRPGKGCNCSQPMRCHRLSTDVPARRAQSDRPTKSGGKYDARDESGDGEE